MNNQVKKLRVLAISGSLRAASSNTVLLRVMEHLAPPNVSVELYEKIGELPHFNLDLDGENTPPRVTDFRAHLHESDAILICSPEYAHGVPGTLKNALDWIVRSGELMEKPIALLNASPSAFHAQQSLEETLTVMMARVTSFRVPLSSNKATQEDVLSNHETCAVLLQALETLKEATEASAN